MAAATNNAEATGLIYSETVTDEIGGLDGTPEQAAIYNHEITDCLVINVVEVMDGLAVEVTPLLGLDSLKQERAAQARAPPKELVSLTDLKVVFSSGT